MINKDKPNQESIATYQELLALVNVPGKNTVENHGYVPLAALRVLRSHILRLKGSQKAELKKLYDKRALELFRDDIQVPSREGAKNPSYSPNARLSVIINNIREYPFMSFTTKAVLIAEALKRKGEIKTWG